MGFAESTYPTLPAIVKAQIPPGGILSKDGEDDIVTNLLEQLLSLSPKTPAQSGSGLKKEGDIPGSWE